MHSVLATMMTQNKPVGPNLPRRPPVPNATTKPQTGRTSSQPSHVRQSFKPTDEEIHLTRQILNSRGLNPESGSLKGEQAREVFNRSALPFPTLRDIWNIADEDGSGDLTREEIVMALRLIGWVQSGEPLSESLLTRVGPLPTLDGITDVQYSKPKRGSSLSGSETIVVPERTVSPAPTVASESVPSISLFPAVNTEHIQEYRTLFVQAGPINGLLGQDKVMNVYMRSNMSYEDLRNIIHAVARRTIQTLDFPEFACGLYVLRALQSSQLHSVPTTIPADIYEQFTESDHPMPSSRDDPGNMPSTSSLSQSTSSPPPEPSPIQLMAAVSSHLVPGRQSVPPNFLVHRDAPPLAPRASQTPGPSSNRYSYIPPQTTEMSTSQADTEWDIPIRDRNNYEMYFYKLDEPGGGYIDKDTFDDFIKVYRVGKEDSDRIWNLTNLTSSGQMNLDEFIIAVHLVRQRSRGVELPAVLPLSLIPPSIRREPSTQSFSQVHPSNLPPLPASRSRTNSESLDSASSSPKVGKKPPPVPPKKGGSISYKKPPSPIVPSPSFGSVNEKALSPTSESAVFTSASSSTSVSPSVPPRPHLQTLKPSLSSSPRVPSISEDITETQLQEQLMTSPFEDPSNSEKLRREYAPQMDLPRRQSSGSASGSGSGGSTDSTIRYAEKPLKHYSTPSLPTHLVNGEPSNVQGYNTMMYQPISPQPMLSPSNEALEGFKEEISRLGRQVDNLLQQLAGQNTVRDLNDSLKIENEILRVHVKDTERMMSEILASSMQQEANTASAQRAETDTRNNQASEEIWRLMAEMSTKETRIEDLERRVEGLSREEKELRDSLREADGQNTKIKNDLAEAERKLGVKDNEMQETKKRLAELERAMMNEVLNPAGSSSNPSGSGSGSGRSKSVKATANNDDPSVKELKVLIRDVTKENEGLKEELRGMQRSMEQMLMSGSRGVVEEIERENRGLKAHVSDLESMVSQLQKSVGVSANQDAIKEIKAQLKDVQRGFTEYRSTNEARTAELSQKVEEMTVENNRLKIELHEAVERGRRGSREDENLPPPAYDDNPFGAST